MPASRVRADHDGLGRIAQTFGRQAAATQKTLQGITRQVEELKGGPGLGKVPRRSIRRWIPRCCPP